MKTISLRVTPEVSSYVDLLHTQLQCSRQESIRRCIIYCVTCTKQVNDYIFTRARLSPQEVPK